MDKGMYKTIYPTGCNPSKSYGLPKIHKKVPPLSLLYPAGAQLLSYGMAKVLTKVLKPLVGKFPHHIQSARYFISRAKGVTLLPGECLCS